jgi:hypothetical protein
MCYRIEPKPVREATKDEEDNREREKERERERERKKTWTIYWRIESSRGEGRNIHAKKERTKQYNFHSLRG